MGECMLVIVELYVVWGSMIISISDPMHVLLHMTFLHPYTSQASLKQQLASWPRHRTVREGNNGATLLHAPQGG